MDRPKLAVVVPLAIALASLAAPAAAQQQQGFALDTFQPSFAGDRFFGVPSPYVAGDLVPHAAFVIDYAHDPLVLRGLPSGHKIGAIVGDQALFHLDATLAIGRFLALNIDLPAAAQHGDAPAGGGVSYPAPQGGALGDLRLGARGAIYGAIDDPFQIGAGALLWLRSGSQAAFTGDGAARGEPQLLMGGVTRWFVWSTMFGVLLRPEIPFADASPGTAFHAGGGIGFLPGEGVQVGPEFTGSVTTGSSVGRVGTFEALIGAKKRFASSFELGLGVGTGKGLGEPVFRGVFSFAYTPEVGPEPAPPLPDRDGDGIPDREDACPDEPGVPDHDPLKNGCPKVQDRDGDKIPDSEDACPDVPGVPDPVPSINGCPPDRDNDKIPDNEDACPDEMGVPDPDPKKNGCPRAGDRDGDNIPDDKDACPDVAGSPDADPTKNGCPHIGDRDGDKIPDDKDACPDDKGPPDPDPAKNGCPRDVRVTDDQIVILQQVEFDTGKATIRPSSKGLLDTIAAVILDHPDILKVEVGGHTDNRGSADENLRLSEARANAVMAQLVKRGVSAERISARGYGGSKPIMSNVTTMGRQKNRRVELKILERRPKDDYRK
jgi:outer membrane protein OmpA-like peptidoglycan-associated protein